MKYGGGGIMVQGCISVNSNEELNIIEENMNGMKCKEILQTNLMIMYIL